MRKTAASRLKTYIGEPVWVQTGRVNNSSVGATTINPYLAFDSLFQRHEKKLFGQFSFVLCILY